MFFPSDAIAKSWTAPRSSREIRYRASTGLSKKAWPPVGILKEISASTFDQVKHWFPDDYRKVIAVLDQLLYRFPEIESIATVHKQWYHDNFSIVIFQHEILFCLYWLKIVCFIRASFFDFQEFLISADIPDSDIDLLFSRQSSWPARWVQPVKSHQGSQNRRL